jgi:hypothetical protein
VEAKNRLDATKYAVSAFFLDFLTTYFAACSRFFTSTIIWITYAIYYILVSYNLDAEFLEEGVTDTQRCGSDIGQYLYTSEVHFLVS